MRLAAAVKKLSPKGILLSLLVAACFGAGLFASSPVHAQSDCDANAVIYCGVTTPQQVKARYNNGSTQSSAGSIQDIYSSFGISANDINTIGANAVQGHVTKNGDVYVGNDTTPVATGAMTAGRQNMPGSTKVTKGGTTFYKRPPSVSFQSASLDALVVMKNGVFQFAIINSCGNPVVATAKTPGYNVVKTVAVKGSNDYKNDVSVPSGTHVKYKVVVKSNGAAPVHNVTVRDKLPANVQYVNNTLQRDGNAVATDGRFFTPEGKNIDVIKPGDSVTFDFEAIIGANDTATKCANEVLHNQADISSPGLPNDSNGADVHKTCTTVTPPTYSCDQLTAAAVSRTQYNYATKASAANGATITGYAYNFGDGTTATSTTATTTHTYATPGTYTATVNAVVQVNNASQNVTSPACSVQVTIGQPPVAECTGFKLDVSSGRAVTATSTYTSGATLTSASYDFGDGTAPVVNSTTTATHTYTADGTYTAKATLTFTVEGKTVTSTCQAPVTFAPQAAYSCDTFNISADSGRVVTVNDFKTTVANGATFKAAVINWGDSTAATTTDTAIGQNHTYAADGTYNVSVTAHFMVNGNEVTATSPACAKPISFTTTPTPTPPAPTPQPPATTVTTLVNTGAGSIIGLFAVVSAIGTFAYRNFLRRHLG